MKKNMVAVAVASALLVPFSANAAKVAGDALEIYGKIHVSVDASDRDITGADNTQDFSVSSNSSRLGFKGKHKMGDSGLTAIYKLEQEVSIGSGSADTLTTRNTYVGVKSSLGQVIAGKHDTPFKTVGSKWGVFGDSVGERRSVLGAKSSGGNTMNQRGENALMWSNSFGDLKAMVMYSADASDDDANVVDTKGDTLTSVGVLYNSKNTPFYLGAAYEDWDQLKGNATDGYRIMLGYKAGFGKVGFIYEDISSNDAALDRSVYGLNGIFKLDGGMDIRGQVLVADDSSAGADTGATRFSLGLFKKFDKKTQMYAAYAQTDNDANAKYQGVDGGHGDEVKTENGGTPSAFSVGIIYKF
jgi:hypothetical protein